MVEWSNVFYGVGFIVVFGFMWTLLSPVFLPIFQSLMKNIRFGADVGITKQEGYLRRI
jgi:uncharacterized membrane protein YadS